MFRWFSHLTDIDSKEEAAVAVMTPLLRLPLRPPAVRLRSGSCPAPNASLRFGSAIWRGQIIEVVELSVAFALGIAPKVSTLLFSTNVVRAKSYSVCQRQCCFDCLRRSYVI
ncbi:unnamed protein product [Musa acuminata var. zebrina]